MNLHTQSTFVHQFPESDTTGSITKDTVSSNRTAAQGRGQSVKPIGSAAARFQIRSAKTLQHRPEPTTKDLRTIFNVFEGGKAESTRRKSDPSKDELHKDYTSSASCKHTDIDYTETPKTVGIQEDESQNGSERSSEALRRFYKSNRSKSLDWRGVASKAELGNRTGITSRNRDHKFIRRADSLEGQGANNKITSQTEEYQPNSISWRIKAYNAASQCDQNSDKKAYPISVQTPVRMSQVTLALERASSGQSLPARLKPRHSQGSTGEGSNPWVQLKQGESSFDQTGNRKGSWAREQGLTNTEEVTGNQTIMERIKKLFGASLTDDKSDANLKVSIRLKHNSTPNSDRSFSFSDPVDSIPSCRKSTTESESGTPSPSSDIQQSRLFYSVDKARTFPRQFSKNEKTFFGQMQEPSTNLENENDKKDASSGLSVPVSSKPKWSMERLFEKKNQSILPADNEEISKMWCAWSPEFCSRSLERTKNRLSATAQSRGCKIQSTSYEGSPTSLSSQGVNHLITTSEDKQSDKVTTKASPKTLDLSERKYLGLQVTSYSDKDQITQPKSPLASKGLAKSEIHEEDVFTVKTEGRKLDGVLEESCVPTLDSVKNTINKFEALAQQSKNKHQILLVRRALSVPEPPKPVALVKKSDSDRNLHYSRVVGNTEGLRTNLNSKCDASEETKDLSRTPQSVSTVKVRPTLEQSRETKESVESPLTLKQLNEPKTDQDVTIWDKNERRTVQNKHIDEPDFAIPTCLGLRKIEAMKGKARNPISQSTITQKSNAKSSLIKQQSINVEMDDDNDDTPTNSPDRATLTISIQRQSYPATPDRSEESQTSGCSDVGVSTPVKSAVLTVNGTHGTVPSSLSHSSISSIPVQTISLNNSNNNNYETTRNDSNIFSASMARWSSDEEDDDDEDDEETETEKDSDSGESSVTITSNMSQSDRRSFSLSLVDLCNFGGVDYKPSDGSVSEDEEDWPSTRSASLSSDISAFSSVTLLSTDELDRLLDDVRSLGDDTLQYEDVQVVVLHKEVGSGLGFTLAGGVDQNKPVTVHKVIPGGVAAQEGSIFEGDRVLSINGTALQNSAHWEALRTLRKARGKGMAVVVLKRGDPSESQHRKKEARQRPGNTGRRIRVTLNKSRSDLGFSLEGGVDSSSGDKPLTVQKIFRGGPVSEVFPGDEMLEVQGQSLVGMRRLEAWNLIKKLPPGPVEVLLNRPHQPH
ncbi:uncharacterized protein LOC127452894 isoform X2 [Myxocyprinus asiaticus]|uniref:uncharacterized protein LOC127452894 isoform X2 n=1 Tax=Myxocyprinus asiaticus TaxID=70543 RepID=UPI002221C85B|nr:uncharacterized protein LOC127452894 isoform X2 [Myxocyprinus asiaticus]